MTFDFNNLVVVRFQAYLTFSFKIQISKIHLFLNKDDK